MSQALQLPDDVYAALERAAAAEGTSPVEFVTRRIPITATQSGCRNDNGTPRTLADRLAGFVGCVAGKVDNRVGLEYFGDHLNAKHRAGE